MYRLLMALPLIAFVNQAADAAELSKKEAAAILKHQGCEKVKIVAVVQGLSKGFSSSENTAYVEAICRYTDRKGEVKTTTRSRSYLFDDDLGWFASTGRRDGTVEVVTEDGVKILSLDD